MMKITIINTLPIPSGNASVNRLLSYAKELAALGNELVVLSSGLSEERVGTLDGVRYFNYGYKGLVKALLVIMKALRKEKPDVVILVSNSLLLIYPIWFTCRTSGIKLLQEKSEFPFVLQNKGFLGILYAKFYVSTTYKLFDGLIVMTKPLMEYFKGKVRKNAKLFEMPMTVDTERFAIEKSESRYGDYIAYCGNMAGNKDGVMNLIDAFDKAFPKIGNVRLLLIGGSTNQKDWDNIVATVKQMGNERIVMFGKATREQMPSLLKNAKALALARPSSLQSTGGFPTKLGEYLSTGNPVIVTKVGDIPNYLSSDNAYLVVPDDNQAFADTIVEVFGDYEKAMAVGAKGKDVALTVFNAKVQSKRLNDFIHTLI